MSDEGTAPTEDVVRLGGNIELSGFKNFDGGSMVILRKIIGNYSRKLSDRLEGYEGVSVRVKPVHGEQSNIFDVSTKLHESGRIVASNVTERNIFVAVDAALKKLEREL